MKWISVEDRLPELIRLPNGEWGAPDWAKKLLRSTCGKIFDGHLVVTMRGYAVAYRCNGDDVISHWMPLPEPPESE